MFQTTTKDLLYSLKAGDIFNIKSIDDNTIYKFIFLKFKLLECDLYKINVFTLKYINWTSNIYLYKNDTRFSIEILK